MTNHPNRSKHAEIRRHILAKPDVEKVRHARGVDQWHVYGRMPNTNEVGWWYYGRSVDVEGEMRHERAYQAAR